MPSDGADPSDMRERFASLPRRADPEAERAFVESQLNKIRTHPTLSEEEKRAAIAEVEEKLRGPEADR